MKKHKKLILFVFLVLIIIIITFLLFRSCGQCSSPATDNSTISENKTLDYTAGINKEDKITLPAVTGVDFKANQLKQSVDFNNPESNRCYFVLELFLSDGTKLWKSDYIKPAQKITELTLNQKLKPGLYRNCQLKYNCYTLTDKKQLNGGQARLEINSY